MTLSSLLGDTGRWVWQRDGHWGTGGKAARQSQTSPCPREGGWSYIRGCRATPASAQQFFCKVSPPHCRIPGLGDGTNPQRDAGSPGFRGLRNILALVTLPFCFLQSERTKLPFGLCDHHAQRHIQLLPDLPGHLNLQLDDPQVSLRHPDVQREHSFVSPPRYSRITTVCKRRNRSERSDSRVPLAAPHAHTGLGSHKTRENELKHCHSGLAYFPATSPDIVWHPGLVSTHQNTGRLPATRLLVCIKFCRTAF